MKRVTGIGGIFFKAKDAPSLQAWYKRHLGIDVQEWGGAAFEWTDGDGKPVAGTTAWSIAPAQSSQFAPSTAPFMVMDTLIFDSGIPENRMRMSRIESMATPAMPTSPTTRG